MEKNQANGQAAPGADQAIVEAITPERVKELLQKDLSIAVACLNAILSDPDLMDSTAHFMAGRWANAKAAKIID